MPNLTTSAGPSRQVTLTWVNGTNGTAACGFWTSGTDKITLYHYAVVNGQQRDCVPDKATAFQNVEHEIGHWLGLGDQCKTVPMSSCGCNNYVMAQYDPAFPRSIQPNECEKADQMNIVAGEPPGDCTVPSHCTCDPSDQTCQGTPIVINYSAGPYVLSGPSDTVFFDLNANGHPEATTWTSKNSGLAFLWLDRNHDGAVDGGTELFGNKTPLPDGGLAANGFEALRQYDLNGDGKIDSSDPIWVDLQLWTDLDHDGFASANEVQPVAGSSIVSISLNYWWTGREDQYGNAFRYEAVVMQRVGRVTIPRPVYDIYFLRVQ